MYEIVDYKWRYCVVGNIVLDRTDEEGNIRHGCKEFKAGTKVYLYGKYWPEEFNYIPVIGLDRHRKYRVVKISKEYIENVRAGRVFKPNILEIMNNFEFTDAWWDSSEEDKLDTKNFAKRWNDKRRILA